MALFDQQDVIGASQQLQVIAPRKGKSPLISTRAGAIWRSTGDEVLHPFRVEVANRHVKPVAQQTPRELAANISKPNKSHFHATRLHLR